VGLFRLWLILESVLLSSFRHQSHSASVFLRFDPVRFSFLTLNKYIARVNI
jgi:hypothetical protein